ncbi:MAG: NAD(P)H-quinone oxidoreductase [Cyanobacteria bacterium M5B4]|nr:MAG: NAD(P)H-quinone oxidoreductase [Cyanobacteria bacterium M5B4]
MLLKSTTRHVHIYAATVKDDKLVESTTELTLDLDPDNEFNWTAGAVQKVNDKFEELVKSYQGADLIDYNIRRIGSDIEHYIRSLLQKGEITYNLNHRALNYSMGLPQIVSTEAEEK